VNLCFTGVILNPRRQQIPELVVKRLHREIIENPHGFYIYAVNPEVYVRTLDIDEFKSLFSRVLSQRPLAVHFHFRYASVGVISVENVHGWRIGDYHVTHNGSVLAYINERILCDSLKLIMQVEFQEYLFNKQWSELYKYIVEKGFYGVMFIVNRDFSEVYAVSMGKSVKYYQIEEVTYATSGELLVGRELKSVRRENYINGVFQITHNKAKILIQKEV
jgi:hypothetical protein